MQYFDAQVLDKKTTERVIKSYKVKVEFDDITEGEMAKKQECVVKAVAKATKKKS